MNEDFWYTPSFSSWESDHPEVINPQTGKVTPAENNTLVTLSVKAYYSAAQIEEAGFLFDPGPLGITKSIRSITLVVPGTNPVDKNHPRQGNYRSKPSERDRRIHKRNLICEREL